MARRIGDRVSRLRFPIVLWILYLVAISPASAGNPATRAAGATPVISLLFAADGQNLLVARQDRVEVRHINSNKSIAIEASMPRVTAIATSRTASSLVAIAGGTPGEAGNVIVWDRDRETRLTIGNFADLATAVTFSPDGAMLAIGSADQTCRLFHLVEKEKAWQANPAGKLVGHGGAVTSIVFSPDGKLIATASVDRSIKVWTVADGALVRTLGNHTDAVNALVSRPQTDPAAPWTIASASEDRTIRIWQPGIGRMVRIVRWHNGPILAVAYTVDGKSVLSVGSEGILRSIDADSDHVLQIHSIAQDWCYALAVSGNGRQIAAGGWDGTAKVWRMDNATLRRLR